MTNISCNHKSDRQLKTCTYQEVQQYEKPGKFKTCNFVTKIEPKIKNKYSMVKTNIESNKFKKQGIRHSKVLKQNILAVSMFRESAISKT